VVRTEVKALSFEGVFADQVMEELKGAEESLKKEEL